MRHYEMKTEPTLVKIIDDVLWCVIKPKGGKRVELIFAFAFLPPVFIVIGHIKRVGDSFLKLRRG